MAQTFDASPGGGASFARPSDSDASPLTAIQAIDLVKNNFNLLDLDGDKFITGDELKNFSAPNLTPRDRLAIEAFAPLIDTIQKVHNDEWFAEEYGASYKDFANLKSGAKDHAAIIDEISAGLPGRDMHDKRAFGNLLAASYEKMDFDRSGTINILEAERFANDVTNSQEEREMAAVVFEHYDDFKSLVGETTKLSEISMTDPFRPRQPGDGELTREDVDAFNLWLARPEVFENYLDDVRSHEIGGGTFGAVVGVGLTACMGVLTIAAPEPLSKTLFGGLTAFTATVTFASGYEIFIGQTDNIRAQYKQRQQMIDSWNHFKT